MNYEKTIKMIIEEKDVSAFLLQARSYYEIGADTVFCQDRLVKPADLHFCTGEAEEATFRHNHPFDYDSYKSYSVRALYETTTLIAKGRVPREEFIFTGWGQDRELIDVGNFIHKREVIANLHHWMKRGDWHYDYTNDFKVWRKGEAFFSTVKVNLHWLSQQVNGLSLANELWTMYAPPHSLRRPDFLSHPAPGETPVQQTSLARDPDNQKKPAARRGRQLKKIKQPGRHRRGI